MQKTIFSAVAVALTFIAFVPYLHAILQDKTKPHVFSWIIWGSTTFVVFLAQRQDGGGIGAWPIGISGLITLCIAVLAYLKKSDNAITKTDAVFFLSAMASLPLWYLTADPLWAVIILTTVDTLGFGPTLRKGYQHPFEEQLSFFALFVARNLCVILALEHYSVTTVLFPAVIAAVSLLLILTISYRRHVLSA